jgi:hypothetical protein
MMLSNIQFFYRGFSLFLFLSFLLASPLASAGDSSPGSAEELKEILSLAQCLRKDKNNADCAEKYVKKVLDYTQPRCSSAGVNPKFAIFATRASPDAKFKKEISIQNQTLYLSESPGVEAMDVEEIRLHQSMGGDWIRLTPAGAKKLKEFSEKNLRQRVAVMAGEKVLSLPLIVDVNHSGELVIAGAEGALNPLCARPITLKLPEDAKLPK